MISLTICLSLLFLKNDHLPCKLQRENVLRDFGEKNLLKFQMQLSLSHWSNVLNDEDPDNAFFSDYNRIFETSFPLKPVKGSNSDKVAAPWMTRGLLNLIRKKNKLYKKYIRNRNSALESQYKSYKNKLNHLIRLAKRNYYDDKFEKTKNDLKKTWKLIHEVINNRKGRQPLPSSFKSDGGMITQPSQIADIFCHYFTNIGPNLANKIPSTSPAFNSFLGEEIIETITLTPVTIEELNEISKSFDSGKAPGYDNIPANVIKKLLALISILLVHVINVSFTRRVFPDKLKVAKVIPVFKGGDPHLFANYRPTSLLPNFSTFLKESCFIA